MDLKGEMTEAEIAFLRECDIPGASLNGRTPAQLTVPQLKRWLACRGASVGGRKVELVQRLV